MIDRSPQHASADARRAVALLLLINLFNYIDRYVLAAVEPLIQADFFPKAATDDRTATMKMGLLATAFLVSYLLLAPVFGWLADRWKRWGESDRMTLKFEKPAGDQVFKTKD